jgi:hypothetical protein
MKAHEQKLIDSISERVVASSLSIDAIAAQLKIDGGLDMAALSEAQIAAVIADAFVGDWNDVGFGFSEVLAYYAAADGKLKGKQIIAWCVAMLVVGRLCRIGVRDWELQLACLLDGLKKTMTILEVDETLLLILYVFSGTAEPRTSA